MNSICNKCKHKNCKYRNKTFKNMTIYCNEHCVKILKNECDQIATDDFRNVVKSLKMAVINLEVLPEY